MAKLIQFYGNPQIDPKPESHFSSLVRSIVYQQLSGKSASAIYKRLRQLYFEKPDFEPEEIFQTDDSVLKSVGLSARKVAYIKELAWHFLSGKINIGNNSNETEIRNTLIAIKGIGPWTIDMFLIFKMSRLDIFPDSDLGVKKGLQILLQLKSSPTKEQIANISNQWRPYRTLATWYLWKIADYGLPKDLH
ncbi:MAG: DNA-3-methyladenine glycosylase 2 family protein [Candidatus Poribacteria bacterium]|nr:DNA-3-methyladenine glycosylase 2 family protein [Candidatus Poribacteria bacterium]